MGESTNITPPLLDSSDPSVMHEIPYTEEIVKKAPKGMFRLIGYDSFEGAPYSIGDCDTLEEAAEIATEKGGTMNLVYIHDDTGVIVDRKGSY